MADFTITLQSTANFCSTQADLLPLAGVGGYSNEPFLTLANDALSDLLMDPNDWKFNRVEMPLFVTCPNKQDAQFGGATIFSLDGSNAQGWGIALSTASTPGIKVSGGVVKVTMIESGHRFVVGETIYTNGVVMTTGTAANYNSVFTDNGSNSQWSNGWVVTAITANSVSFAAVSGQNNNDAGGAPGITNFAFSTSASMVQMTDTSSPQFNQDITTARELPVTSRVGNPEKVSVLHDNGDGTLKIRTYLCSGSTIWGVKFVYQAKLVRKVALTDNWAPFPDGYSALITQAMLYRMYRYLNSPTADKEYMKLQEEIKKAQAVDDAEPTNVYVIPEEPILSGDYWWGF